MKKTDFGVIESFQLGADNSVPPAAKQVLDRDGVVCLCGAFDSARLNVIEAGIETALNGASTDVDIVKRKTDAGSLSVSSGAWRQVEEFRQFIFDSHICDIALSLLGTKPLVLFYDFLLIKEALSNNAATPWHQDHSYYPLDGT
ncbi:MAG: ectoine hydroxylase-related dioxygenase (phytanoyl-CoA dioxygenase family) [Gammaproteobacteria bacterium]|jgi:ectoine hydroxylase-related dioxygenase (phytanoyl-CoA dioxygenase family)